MPEFINQHVIPAALCEALLPLTEDGDIRAQAIRQLTQVRNDLQGQITTNESPSKRVMQGIIQAFK